MDTTQLTPQEFQIFHQGHMSDAYRYFGSQLVNQEGKQGVRFTVWAPRARQVNVVGDFNGWQGERNSLSLINDLGIWTGFVPEAQAGQYYKYQLITATGESFLKADPFAFYAEIRPGTASVIYDLAGYQWQDQDWLQNRSDLYEKPLNIYEVHLGSWRRKPDGSCYSYREIAPHLISYAKEMGYTHLELMPIMEYPYDGSWGYQITGFYAVTSRYGTPKDFMYLVDLCHQNGLGVILDWVPAHFCKDAHGLANFDGSPLYEGEEHHEWGTLQFDYDRPEVASFLNSNACFWLEAYHLDGLRVDAVASMLYLDYGRHDGDWKPNSQGGKENLAAVAWMQQLSRTVFKRFPHALLIAEESTAWPLVTKPTYDGGLGYNYKWNMGWMNDSLRYMQIDPFFRPGAHHLLTFSFMYAFAENFLLPLSHDEVVHGKKSLIEKMPGDYWHKFANLRVFLGYQIAHPGKKLLFMGGEIAQFIEWRFYEQLEWKLLEFEMHRQFQNYVRELNHFYLRQSALWELDFSWEGFKWIDCDNAAQSIIILQRSGKKQGSKLLVICNFTPVAYENFRIGVEQEGNYLEVFNSDRKEYGGSGMLNCKSLKTTRTSWHNQEYSLEMKVAPLAIHFLKRQN